MTISIGAISQQKAAHKATPTFQHFAFFIFTKEFNSIQLKSSTKRLQTNCNKNSIIHLEQSEKRNRKRTTKIKENKSVKNV